MNYLHWTNQSNNQADWITFTTPQNKSITLPPCIYLLWTEIQQPPTTQQLEDLRFLLDLEHIQARVPEPMIQYESHYQLF